MFRDASTLSTFRQLAQAVRGTLVGWQARPPRASETFEALLAACTYEGSLADAGIDAPAARAAVLADSIADLFVSLVGLSGQDESTSAPAPEVARCLDALDPIKPPSGGCTVKRSEGFAYYALRPEAVLQGLPETGGARQVVVVGIRTIGTALSALAAAGLRRRFQDPARVCRLTVRPTGHPYDRRLHAPLPARATVRGIHKSGTLFIVIDEGPGMSGSSLLAVAEWLESQGVPATQIVLYASHVPDPATLVAPNAESRWRRYGSRAFAPQPIPEAEDLSGGGWRIRLGLPEECWPAVWGGMEREKRLVIDSAHGPCVEKFEGLAEYGRFCARRAASLGSAGFGPELVAVNPRRGTLLSRLVGPGTRPPEVSPIGGARVSIAIAAAPKPIDRLAAYCAYRGTAAEFRPAGAADQDALWEALFINSEQELGGAPRMRDVRAHDAVVVDGRMQPHEWVLSSAGILVKTDGTSHGDDHFIPGPTDIAWDLAGAMVEWEMNRPERAAFLNRYWVLTHDHDWARIGAYEVGYCAFRAAACGMALHAAGRGESKRWTKERQRYRVHGQQALARLRASEI